MQPRRRQPDGAPDLCLYPGEPVQAQRFGQLWHLFLLMIAETFQESVTVELEFKFKACSKVKTSVFYRNVVYLNDF